MVLGGTKSAYDCTLFMWLIGILVSHVDDLAFCRTELFQEKIICKLKKTFKINTHDIGSFKYLGLELC